MGDTFYYPYFSARNTRNVKPKRMEEMLERENQLRMEGMREILAESIGKERENTKRIGE